MATSEAFQVFALDHALGQKSFITNGDKAKHYMCMHACKLYTIIIILLRALNLCHTL